MKILLFEESGRLGHNTVWNLASNGLDRTIATQSKKEISLNESASLKITTADQCDETAGKQIFETSCVDCL